ncbi:CBS domain-containing protein [Portibacter lacus]|nr:CBS domain-containing protein [Portibacter lacus]
MKNQRVIEIMNKDPKCLEKSSPLKSVVELISAHRFSHVPVLSEGKLVGIVSKSDLINRFLQMLNQTSGKFYSKMLMEHIKVEDIMKADPITIHENDDIEYASELLLQGEFHSLIVLNDKDAVTGIVTAYDILKAKSQ